ncbi:MAG TPA: hypothetical protein VLW45_06945 [Pelomicrobium sp.]|nr:hypothetical protein [Pelomicrobium sp.]
MIRKLTTSLFVITGLALAAPALSAGYIKLGGVQGESTKARPAPTPAPAAPANKLQGSQDPKPAGLLLPAVQSAREAAPESPAGKKKGNVEYGWKVEKGEK